MRAGFAVRLKVYVPLLICPGPECVTLMCTNLSNTEINEAPAHPRGIHLCG